MGKIVGNSRIDLAGLQHALIQRLQFEMKLDLRTIPTSDVKAVTTGSGNADKNQMYEYLPEDIKERVNAYEPHKTKGRPDIVDAFWISRCLERQLELLQA